MELILSPSPLILGSRLWLYIMCILEVSYIPKWLYIMCILEVSYIPKWLYIMCILEVSYIPKWLYIMYILGTSHALISSIERQKIRPDPLRWAEQEQ